MPPRRLSFRLAISPEIAPLLHSTQRLLFPLQILQQLFDALPGRLERIHKSPHLELLFRFLHLPGGGALGRTEQRLLFGFNDMGFPGDHLFQLRCALFKRRLARVGCNQRLPRSWRSGLQAKYGLMCIGTEWHKFFPLI